MIPVFSDENGHEIIVGKNQSTLLQRFKLQEPVVRGWNSSKMPYIPIADALVLGIATRP